MMFAAVALNRYYLCPSQIYLMPGAVSIHDAVPDVFSLRSIDKTTVYSQNDSIHCTPWGTLLYGCTSFIRTEN